MNNNQKITLFVLALLCNFTFLATAQRQLPIESARKFPECIRFEGVDTVTTRHNMAYFQENWKKRNYAEAYSCWSYVFNNAPCSYKSIYQLGPQLLHIMINSAENMQRKEGLVDTLLMIFPARIRYFGEEAYVKGSWAYYLSMHRPSELSEVITLYSFYFEYQKDRLDGRYVKDYMRSSIRAYQQSMLAREQVCKLYHMLRDTASSYYNKTQDKPGYSKAWEDTIHELDNQKAQYFPDCAALYDRRGESACRPGSGKVFAFNRFI